MRRGAWILPVVLLVLVTAWAGWIRLSGKAFLPRHTSARDLPYALGGGVPEQPFNRAMTDAVNLIYPDAVAAHAALREGRLPLWNHDVLCGSAHSANPLTGTFYPPTFLLAWLEPIDFLLVSAALHVLLAGILCHLFLIAAGVRPTAAQVGAAAFALSGWTAAHLHNTPIVAVVAWIPLGLGGIEWLLSDRPKRGTLALAFSLAFQWLAGFPVIASFGTLALALYGLFSLLLARRSRSTESRPRLAVRILVAAVLGILLASVQVLPTLDARARAGRTGSTRAELLAGQTFEPGVLSGAAFPRWLGNAHEKSVTETPVESDRDHQSRFIAGRLVLGRGRPAETAPVNNFGERTIYAGAPIVLLAICGLFSLRRRGAVALVATATLATAFALGALPPDSVLSALGLNVGAPGRAIVLVVIALPCLAAFGLDHLLDRERPSRAAWLVLRVSGIVLGAGGLVAAVFAYAAPDRVLDRIVLWLRDVNAAAVLGGPADRPLAEYAAALRPAFERLRGDLLWFAFFVEITWAVVEWARRAARGPETQGGALRTAGLVLVAIVAIDLGAFFLDVVRPVARGRLYEPTPALEYLKSRTGDGRILRAAPDRATARGDVDVLLQPNIAMVHGIRDAQGYREMVPSLLLRLMEGTAVLPERWRDFPMGYSGIALDSRPSPVVDLLAARWIIASKPLEPAPAFAASEFKPAFRSESRPDILVYENPRALPYGRVVHDAIVKNDDDAVRTLKSAGWDPRKKVILDSMPPGASTSATEPAPGEEVSVRFERDAIRLDATLSSPGFVVLSQCWDPGWKATHWSGPWKEDRGSELPVVRADAAFMAVFAPAGRHTIELRYWPARLTGGLSLAGASLLVLAVLTFWPRRRNPPPVPPDAAP
jgi:hypothetical protein